MPVDLLNAQLLPTFNFGGGGRAVFVKLSKAKCNKMSYGMSMYGYMHVCVYVCIYIYIYI